MIKALISRIKQGYRTGTFPQQAPTLPDDFQGRPTIEKGITSSEAQSLQACCPTKAISTKNGKIALDLGKCIFCKKCSGMCSKIHFTKEYRMATFKREDLIITEDTPADRVFTNPKEEIVKLCGNSLKIRQVSAGGCAACELDFNVLNTLAWDMGRFGIQVVASPRHADVILVTGPVTKNMLLGLMKTYDAMAKPSYVIACGACAISGGIYAQSEQTMGGLSDIYLPDMYIPGCPPHPTTTLHALLAFMGK